MLAKADWRALRRYVKQGEEKDGEMEEEVCIGKRKFKENQTNKKIKKKK